MKIAIYVNWCDNKILTLSKFEEEVADLAKEYSDDTAIFEEWLSDKYSVSDIFFMSAENKEKITTRFKDHCRDFALTDLNEEYERVELEF